MLENKSKTDKSRLYIRAYSRLVEKFEGDPSGNFTDYIPKLVWFGVKIVNDAPGVFEKGKGGLDKIGLIKIIMKQMATLTPGEFMNLFPITKEFDLKQKEIKNYYSTRQYLNSLPHNQPIGGNTVKFLKMYYNHDIHLFYSIVKKRQPFLLVTRTN